MRAFRFIVPTDRFYPLPSNPDLSVRGCVAVTVAETVEEATAALKRYAAAEGLDVRWLEVARVSSRPIEAGATLVWVEV